jgi:GT2 family glycosyltransferase
VSELESAPSDSVAVIVVNANGGPLLAKTLDHVSRQTLEPARVIVVDNASTDGSVDAVEQRRPEIEVVRLERNVGFAAANNLAARRADDCDWIALLNPDAFAAPTWLEELARAADTHPEYVFFASRLDAVDSSTLDGRGDSYHVSGWAWQRDHGRRRDQVHEGPSHEVFSPCAAAAMYRREVFLEAGGFDERFFCYAEDTDLAFRLRLAGHRCLYVPQALVEHVGSATAGRESDFGIYHAHRNLVWTYFKNMPSPLVWLYLPQHVLMNLLVIAWFSVRGHARSILRAKVDALRGLPAALGQRRAIQAKRVRSAADLRRTMARGVSGYVNALRLARRA